MKQTFKDLNFMPSCITDIIINGKASNPSATKKIISAISDSNILQKKGGYLFMMSISGDCCNLGIQPYQIDGERKYHYEIEMPEDAFMLTGFINSNRSLTLLFKLTPEKYKAGLSQEEKNAYREVFIKFARFLLEHGFPEDFEIDLVTNSLLTSAGIIDNGPQTVEELSALTLQA